MVFHVGPLGRLPRVINTQKEGVQTDRNREEVIFMKMSMEERRDRSLGKMVRDKINRKWSPYVK